MKALAVMVWLSSSLGCAHFFDPCDNKLLNRVPSPDGTLLVATYHRECRSVVLTTAAVEKANGEVVCSLMSWPDKYGVEATWQGKDAIAINTTDRVEKADVLDSTESCEGIKVSYSFQFRNEQQRTDDEAMLSRMRTVLSDLQPCIDGYYKSANSPDSPVVYMNQLIQKGEHRSAVQNLMSYTGDAACPVSAETYDSFSQLSSTFDLKPAYLARVATLVKR